ncbi:cilia- and flagella-associated protein 161-like [Leptopilina heterotoma]|uniref:cilia- and flagella-associated protein 161-like n=1 Tax=Leptopilina heterotoma TaxID=63436 RepID=UPI001CA93720|nr:cilia- and flagella-associated protein 161-like [Leptopilina heterotoma]
MPIVCAAISEPFTRNTFTILASYSNKRDGEKLLFGQNFILKLTDSTEEDLYLRSVTPLIDDTRGPGEHNRVLLSNIKDCYCLWKVLLCNKSQRFESEGTPVPVSDRIVITHVMTGECLAVERLNCQSSIFGVECGISVHTYRDVNKRETPECHWMFVTEKVPRGTAEKECK